MKLFTGNWIFFRENAKVLRGNGIGERNNISRERNIIARERNSISKERNNIIYVFPMTLRGSVTYSNTMSHTLTIHG